VNKLLRVLNKEFRGLHQAAFLLGASAIFSQALALLRDRLFAGRFGASGTLDLYYAAFRIPDLLYASIASFVSVTVLIPFIIERMDNDRASAGKFLSDVFSVYLTIMFVVSTVAFLFTPFITRLFFVGFSGEEQATLIALTRLLLLSPILLGVSNLFGSVTQTARKFFVYALSPVLYNLGIIFGVLLLYPSLGILGLGYGVVFGAALHLLVQYPVVSEGGLVPRFSLKVRIEDIKKVVALSLPRTLGLSVYHFTFLILVSFASRMTEGSISIFNLSFNLQSVPLAIIGISYSVAAFPVLVGSFSRNDMVKFMEDIGTAARHIIFWSFPITALFIVLRAQIVRTILGSGRFGWSDTMLAAACLALFSISLIAQSLILLFVRGYYAAGNTRKPVVATVISSVSVIGFSMFLISYFTSTQFFRFFIESFFRVEGANGTVVLMLPLAYSIGNIINAVLLAIMFRRDFGHSALSVARTFFQSFSAAVCMGFVAYQSLHILDAYVFGAIDTLPKIFLQGLLSGMAGIIAGIILLKVLGNAEIEEVWRAFHSRFWKVRVFAPESQEL